MKAAFLVVILLSLIWMISKAQASSTIEKFPTATSMVVAGWNDPENAYSENGVYATSATSTAQQEYTDFGFNFNESDTIEKVWLKSKFNTYIDGSLVTITGKFDVRIWRGGTSWVYCTFDYIDFATIEGWGESSTIIRELAFDITALMTNKTALNNFTCRLRSTLMGADNPLIQVDYVSVEVAYTIEKMSFTSGFMLGGVLCGLVALVAILIVEKKD